MGNKKLSSIRVVTQKISSRKHQTIQSKTHFMKLYIYLISLICLISCGKGNSNGFDLNFGRTTYEAPATATEMRSDLNDQEPINTENSIQRKLIKEGYFDIESDDINKTCADIKNRVKILNGYISNESENNYSYSTQRNFTIRIKSEDFDAFIDTILTNAIKINTKNITVRDVTEEFIDIESRLKNRKQLENKYLELLTKAKVVTEILEIEKEINSIREEIESTEGRLKYLSNQVAYSTINLTVEMKSQSGLKQENKLVKSLKNGWKGFVTVFYGLISIWPFLLIAMGLLFVFKKIRDRKKTN